MVPSRFILLFLLRRGYSHKALDRLMRRLEEHLQKKGEDTNLRGLMLQICNSSLSENHKSDNARDCYLGPIAVNAAFMRDAPLFSQTVKKTTRGFVNNYYFV